MRDEFAELLEEALRPMEARAGIEGRVMARVAAVEQRPAWRAGGLRWAMGGVVAMGLVVMGAQVDGWRRGVGGSGIAVVSRGDAGRGQVDGRAGRMRPAVEVLRVEVRRPEQAEGHRLQARRPAGEERRELVPLEVGGLTVEPLREAPMTVE